MERFENRPETPPTPQELNTELTRLLEKIPSSSVKNFQSSGESHNLLRILKENDVKKGVLFLPTGNERQARAETLPPLVSQLITILEHAKDITTSSFRIHIVDTFTTSYIEGLPVNESGSPAVLDPISSISSMYDRSGGGFFDSNQSEQIERAFHNESAYAALQAKQAFQKMGGDITFDSQNHKLSKWRIEFWELHHNEP